MLRLRSLIKTVIAKPAGLSRCLVTEANKNLDDLPREKKIKVLELEMSVSLKINISIK